ncbi:MAG: radical SAM protein [Sumerlaeia bacterium]
MISDVRKRKHALHYTTANWDTVNCSLCSHQCSVAPSRSGACGVRSNRDGKFYVDTYGRIAFSKLVSGFEIPLYHFAPQLKWLLVGTRGCTMRCPFCNTYEYAQLGARNTTPMTPDDVVKRALGDEAGGIVFGGNEPVVSHEFVLDVFRLARRAGLKTALQTNGTWMEEPFQEVLILTDAFTFGLKGFSESRYSNQLGGQLNFILQNIRTAVAQNHHVEISYLLCAEPREKQVRELQDFLAWRNNLNEKIPVIFNRQKPDYLLKTELNPEVALTLVEELELVKNAAYYFDSAKPEHNTTYCKNCAEAMITRSKSGSVCYITADGCCPNCRQRVEDIIL